MKPKDENREEQIKTYSSLQHSLAGGPQAEQVVQQRNGLRGELLQDEAIRQDNLKRQLELHTKAQELLLAVDIDKVTESDQALSTETLNSIKTDLATDLSQKLLPCSSAVTAAIDWAMEYDSLVEFRRSLEEQIKTFQTRTAALVEDRKKYQIGDLEAIARAELTARKDQNQLTMQDIAQELKTVEQSISETTTAKELLGTAEQLCVEYRALLATKKEFEKANNKLEAQLGHFVKYPPEKPSEKQELDTAREASAQLIVKIRELYHTKQEMTKKLMQTRQLNPEIGFSFPDVFKDIDAQTSLDVVEVSMDVFNIILFLYFVKIILTMAALDNSIH